MTGADHNATTSPMGPIGPTKNNVSFNRSDAQKTSTMNIASSYRDLFVVTQMFRCFHAFFKKFPKHSSIILVRVLSVSDWIHLHVWQMVSFANRDVILTKNKKTVVLIEKLC